MESGTGMTARAAWSLTTERVIKSLDGLDLGALLGRIEQEMPTTPKQMQCLVGHLSRQDRHQLPRTSRPRYRHRRDAGRLPRLPDPQRLHVAVWAGLDQGDSWKAGVSFCGPVIKHEIITY